MAIDAHSISLINYLDNITINVSEIRKRLYGVEKPSQLIDQLDDIKKLIEKINASIRITDVTLQALYQEYNSYYVMLGEMRLQLSSKVEHRNSLEVQPNTMGSLYNEERLLVDICINKDVTIDCSVNQIYMDVIYDISKYSYLSIVNKMMSELSLAKDIYDITSCEFTKGASCISSLVATIYAFKEYVTSGTNIDLMCEDDPEAYAFIKKMLQNLTIEAQVSQFKKAVTKLFQVYNSIKSNYEIYVQAVSGYTSLVLESFFNEHVTL